MKRADIKINSGDEKLFPRSKWISVKKLSGENKVLKSPLLHTAFRLILKKHIPKHKIAFLSLCTTTRPYSLSKKWKKFIEAFDAKADLMVVSNGGFIPKAFWNSYPFLNYDAGNHENNDLISLMCERMVQFFKKHPYEYVIANFSHKQKNQKLVIQSLTELKSAEFIKDFIVIPDKKTYEKAQVVGWNENGMMFPDLHPIIFNKLKRYINKYNSLT